MTTKDETTIYLDPYAVYKLLEYLDVLKAQHPPGCLCESCEVRS